jgi:predicted CXXCH cytochrome family protein
MHPVRSASLALATLVLSAAGFVCGTVFAQDSTGRPQKIGPSKYVGTDVCQGCHEDQYKTFAASAHVHTLKMAKAEAQGCESCHGPGAAHVEGGGDPEKIQRFAGASPETIQQHCAGCHAVNLGAAHTKAQLTCFTCHSVHHYQQLKSILVAPEAQLCQRCHNQDSPQSKSHRR